MPIVELRPSDSPRLSGEDSAHIRTLAESEAVLPPVLVHRSTMRVIDGMHRLQAAIMRGEHAIPVRFFDGPAKEAFVLGVKANITHGLPLSLSDRRAAALRIIASHPHWSDRAIAEATGLAARTVGTIRASGEGRQSLTRIGRDGRARPISTADGRMLASTLMTEKPAESLRRIATAAGVSLATVRDVRDRLARGEDPVPPQQKQRCEQLLTRLKQDPSLRGTESGRTLIRLLSIQALGVQERKQLLDTVPAHCRDAVADLARACARTWQELASWLES